MTVANLITFLRVLLVPLIVWAMLSDCILIAFVLLILAGLSDAIDGSVARLFNQQSKLGTLLDPFADKILLVSVFIVLSYLGHLPIWLVVLVASRDMLILSSIIIAFFLGKPLLIKPLWISKLNTLTQIILTSLILGFLVFNVKIPILKSSLEWITGFLTALSAIIYSIQGSRHFMSTNTKSPLIESIE
ncbi:CDP-alcohol phosphatidyltransferase family protein [Candidatus Endowatersipora endosymbiont of Watersipora subatra]|uniref:CDP-alcohol phosphatidyltransferase family protein n=1 Tax=Candidatus Endowatersipora endosymbiont of Watersipora subatra TaxID=3077946 RepID=UPI00312C9546